MKLFETILNKYPNLFGERDKTEIRGLLQNQQDNKYLTAVVMFPYILHESDAYRRATTNYLVFMKEATDRTSAFARIIVNNTVEDAYDRLKWFYVGLYKSHPIYPLLLAGENGTRERKGIAPSHEPCFQCPDELSLEQQEAMNEIKNYDKPAPSWWWVDDPPPTAPQN